MTLRLKETSGEDVSSFRRFKKTGSQLEDHPPGKRRFCFFPKQAMHAIPGAPILLGDAPVQPHRALLALAHGFRSASARPALNGRCLCQRSRRSDVALAAEGPVRAL